MAILLENYGTTCSIFHYCIIWLRDDSFIINQLLSVISLIFGLQFYKPGDKAQPTTALQIQGGIVQGPRLQPDGPLPGYS
jgi:hypothetical protein